MPRRNANAQRRRARRRIDRDDIAPDNAADTAGNLDKAARALVDRGLASPAILGSHSWTAPRDRDDRRTFLERDTATTRQLTFSGYPPEPSERRRGHLGSSR